LACAALPAAAAPGSRASTLDPGWDESAPRWSPDGRTLLVQRAWESPKMGAFYELSGVGLNGERRRVGRPERTILEQWDRDGRWSPDGTLVAFNRLVGLDADYVYVTDAEGTAQHRLSPDESGRDTSPTWSPDGQRLAFDSGGRIATMRVDGSDARFLTAGTADHEPRWSPDGRLIAFTRTFFTKVFRTAVYVVRPDGSGLRRLTPLRDYVVADWSPDSSRLLASHGGTFSRDRVVVLQVRRAREVTLGRGSNPTWSPRGDRVAFQRSDGLYVVSSRGGAARRVYGFPKPMGVNDDSTPDWAPNGRWLAFAQPGVCLAWGAYVLDLETRRARRISNDCTIVGTRRRDVLRGTNERDVIRALSGDDVVDGNPGDRRNEYAGRRDDDMLDGGPGDDTIRGRRDHDVLRGGPGNDRLIGDDGRDVFAGGPGADRFFTRDDLRESIRCGSGRDRVQADERDSVNRDCELVVRDAN
jgi:Tol biopolymer transport system component